MTSWEIHNANGRWDPDTYPTREAAERELRSFFHGIRVDLKKFTIVQVAPEPRENADD